LQITHRSWYVVETCSIRNENGMSTDQISESAGSRKVSVRMINLVKLKAGINVVEHTPAVSRVMTSNTVV